jgi:ribosomal protein S24E
MDMRHSTISEKENPYMRRKEIVLKLDHPEAPTPANAGLQQHLAKEWKVEPEQVEIRHIYSQVGRQHSKAHVFLWQEKKAADLSKPTEQSEQGKPATAASEAKAAEEKK